MKYSKIVITGLLCSSTMLNAGWMDTLSQGLNTLEKTGVPVVESSTAPTTKQASSSATSSVLTSLSSNDMNGALKEALNKGVTYAVSILGKDNGYLSNPLTKIGLPDGMQKTADLVRKAGGDKYVDDLILAVNNAASEAAPKTAAIFSKSISNMGIDDAKKILSGSDNAATDYFRATTTKDLQATISPIIQKSMDNNEVAKYYSVFQSFYKENAGILKNEYVSGAASMFGYGDVLPSDKDEDINGFVTNKSIDGIMLMIQEQEKNIRNNPLTQNNELIGKVFSVFK